MFGWWGLLRSEKVAWWKTKEKHSWKILIRGWQCDILTLKYSTGYNNISNSNIKYVMEDKLVNYWLIIKYSFSLGRWQVVAIENIKLSVL